jgi:hypothetical protein
VVTNTGPYDIVFPDTDPAFPASGLRQSSVFKIPKLFTLSTSLGLNRLGNLSPEWFDRVREAVRNAI